MSRDASSSSDTTDGSRRLYVVSIAGVAAIGGFLFGFDSGVINGTIDALSEAFGAGDVGTGFSVASVLLGCAVGAFYAGRWADRFGRRPVMLVTAVVFAVSAWGSGFANGATEFVVYRLVGGLAVGGASVLAPAYISEVAPAHLRGRLASLQQLAIVVGLSAAFGSNYALARISGGSTQPLWWGLPTWRWMFWVEIIPAAAFALGTLLIPESPRFLIAQGRVDAAARVFRRIVDEDIPAKIESVRKTLGGSGPPNLSDLLSPGTRRLRPIVWIGIGLSVFQQFVGINVVFYYGAVLWTSAGFDESQALLTNVITGTTNVAATFVAIATIDRFGRKPLLIIGSIGMTATLGLLAYLFSTGTLGPDGQLQLPPGVGTTALVTANLYVVFFALSWGPVVWVLLGEMFSNRIRGAGLAVAAAAQWLANFTITMTFPVLLGRLGLAGAYGLYCLFAGLSFVFVRRWVVETRGRELETM